MKKKVRGIKTIAKLISREEGRGRLFGTREYP